MELNLIQKKNLEVLLNLELNVINKIKFRSIFEPGPEPYSQKQT